MEEEEVVNPVSNTTIKTNPSGAYVSEESGVTYNNELNNPAAPDSVIRNRANKNDNTDQELPSDTQIISEMISSASDKKSRNSPKTYLKMYSNNEQSTNKDHSSILEQSKQPLLYEKERLVAIVKPTNSESVSTNVFTSQKDDLGPICDGRPPDFKVTSSIDNICSGDQHPGSDIDNKDSMKEQQILSVDFDAILPHVGEMGRYQLALYLLMCIPATLPAAFLAFNQVFLSATPTHWCREPHLYKYNEVGFDNSIIFLLLIA